MNTGDFPIFGRLPDRPDGQAKCGSGFDRDIGRSNEALEYFVGEQPPTRREPDEIAVPMQQAV